MCRDPEVRKNVNKKQNEWTRQLSRSGSNSVLLEQKSRSRKWWEIRLEILARGLIYHNFSLSNMFGYISWALKSGCPTLLIDKPCCSWCLHAARAANVPPFDLWFLRKGVRILKTVRGVIDFDLQRIGISSREAWALGTEFGKAEIPLPTENSSPEGVSPQLLAKIL